MYHKPDRPVSAVQIAMVLPGVLMILFVWGFFLVQGESSREEALQARLAENRNLALIVSESLKQMTDRAGAVASLAVASTRKLRPTSSGASATSRLPSASVV